MARKQREEVECGNWMDTYGDMVTLLLTFFVMLFSMSSIDAEKWEMLVQAFTNKGNETSQVVLAPEGEGQEMADNQGKGESMDIDITNSMPTDISELYDYLKEYVEQNNMTDSVQLVKGEGSVFIRFQDNIFFNANSYYLRRDGFPILDFLGNCLKNVEDQIVTININGHTAAIPWDENYQINDRRLSSERASSVAVFFEEDKNLDPKKILAIGYGKNYPIATNDTDEGRIKNRRVDMIIVGDEATLSNEAIVTQVLTGTFDEGAYPDSGSSNEIMLPSNTAGMEITDVIDTPADSGAPGAVGADSIPQSTLDTGDTPPADTPPADTQQPAAGQTAPIEGETGEPPEPSQQASG